MAEVVRTGVPLCGVEARVERRDGTFVWAVFHITPIRDDDGAIVGAINCFHERANGEPLFTPATSPNDWIQTRDSRLTATYEHVGAGIVEVDEDDRVVGFVEKPDPDQIDTNLINAGAYVLEREVLDMICCCTLFERR